MKLTTCPRQTQKNKNCAVAKETLEDLKNVTEN